MSNEGSMVSDFAEYNVNKDAKLPYFWRYLTDYF